jgi:hypothetical protein
MKVILSVPDEGYFEPWEVRHTKQTMTHGEQEYLIDTLKHRSSMLFKDILLCLISMFFIQQ